MGIEKELGKKADELRNVVLDMCIKAETGHVSSCFSCAEILTALYYGGILKYDIKNPSWNKRDRFVLSKGHASPLLYAVLSDVGFFPKEWLDKFAQADGKFGVHLQCDIPGVEVTSGSLGHGLGIGAGIALAAKMNRENYFTFVLLGDGECYEGSVWESAMFASHNHLNNLIAIVDRNNLCVTDYTENLVRLNPFDEKWKSFGWDVKTVNGHSVKEILSALEDFRSYKRNNPYVIIANTTKGKGISFIENQVLWHGLAPKGEEAKKAQDEMKEAISEYKYR